MTGTAGGSGVAAAPAGLGYRGSRSSQTPIAISIASASMMIHGTAFQN